MEPKWFIWLRKHMPKDLFKQFESDRKHDIEWRDQEIARLRSPEIKNWYLFSSTTKKFVEGPLTREQVTVALKGYLSSDVRPVQINEVQLNTVP